MHWKTWGQHVAIAGAYAACYEVVRYVSFSHWMLMAGLRLACLLLVPTRFWPALAVGEALPVAENALQCLPQFGSAWAVSAAVPIIVLCMACVLPLRHHWPLYGADGRVRMGMVLGATLGCAVLTAVKTSLTLLTALLGSSGAWPDISVPTYFLAYLLGAYLSALTVTPTLLALHARAQMHRRITVDVVWNSALLRDALQWALPALAGLAWVALATSDDGTRQLARAAMMLPLFGLAWRHAWHGSAIGGLGASVALAATGRVPLDPAMIQSQVVLTLCVSGLLFVGVRAPRVARADRTSVSSGRHDAAPDVSG